MQLTSCYGSPVFGQNPKEQQFFFRETVPYTVLTLRDTSVIVLVTAALSITIAS